MTRKEIAQKIMQTLPSKFFTRKSTQLSFDFVPPSPRGIRKAEECCDIVIAAIKRTLMAGEPVEINGFGKFVIRQKKERMGRNPRTKEEAVITARRVVSFKPSKILRNMVNNNPARQAWFNHD